jgi:flagellar motor switch protein FliG
MTTDSGTRRKNYAKVSGRKRAAALLIALGPELAAEVLRALPEDDIGRLTWEIVGIGQLGPDDREDIMTTFYETVVGRDFVSIGGLEYAQDMLRRAVGDERADDIVTRLAAHTGTKPFTFLQQVDNRDLINFIQSEHPQVVSLLLAYMGGERASNILQNLPSERQAEVSVRLALMERTTPEVLADVETAIRTRLGTVFSPRSEMTQVGGIDSLVDLLRRVDVATEKAIIEGLESADPDTANEIKKRMFVFENITLLDDRSIQRVLREVDGKDLGLALKGASDEVRTLILRNMSERAAAMLVDDMETLGPVRLRHVEEAQGRIVATIRRLEEAEEIYVQRGGEESLVA